MNDTKENTVIETFGGFEIRRYRYGFKISHPIAVGYSNTHPTIKGCKRWALGVLASYFSESKQAFNDSIAK